MKTIDLYTDSGKKIRLNYEGNLKEAIDTAQETIKSSPIDIDEVATIAVKKRNDSRRMIMARSNLREKTNNGCRPDKYFTRIVKGKEDTLIEELESAIIDKGNNVKDIIRYLIKDIEFNSNKNYSISINISSLDK